MAENRVWRAGAVGLIVGLGTILLFAAGGPYLLAQTPRGTVDWTPLLPHAPGRDYAVALCTSCHNAGYLLMPRRSAMGWRYFLQGMNAREAESCGCIGGTLDQEEIDILSAYLSISAGPDNPIDQLPLNVNTASAPALLRLPGLKEYDVEKLMEQRSRRKFSTHAEVEQVVGSDTFSRIRDLIQVLESY